MVLWRPGIRSRCTRGSTLVCIRSPFSHPANATPELRLALRLEVRKAYAGRGNSAPHRPRVPNISLQQLAMRLEIQSRQSAPVLAPSRQRHPRGASLQARAPLRELPPATQAPRANYRAKATILFRFERRTWTQMLTQGAKSEGRCDFSLPTPRRVPRLPSHVAAIVCIRRQRASNLDDLDDRGDASVQERSLR